MKFQNPNFIFFRMNGRSDARTAPHFFQSWRYNDAILTCTRNLCFEPNFEKLFLSQKYCSIYGVYVLFMYVQYLSSSFSIFHVCSSL